MIITAHILTPDLVEVTVRPSWWRRFLGAKTRVQRAERLTGIWQIFGWLWVDTHAQPGVLILLAIAKAFADTAERRLAERRRNYQAAAERGEYPLR